MAAPRKFWNFKNSTSADTAELDLLDEIGGWGVTAQQFRAELKQVTAPKLKVNINSPGGDITEGLAIYNLLKQHSAEVETNIIGMAASMASIIACAGDKVTMAENSFMFVHQPWNLAMGDADDLRAEADLLDKFGDSLAGVYAAKSGQDKETCSGWMEDETLFSAQEAKDAGLCDEIMPAMEAAANAKAELQKFFPAAGEKPRAKVDKQIITTPKSPSPSKNSMSLLSSIQNEFGKDAAKLQFAMAFDFTDATTIEQVREHVAAQAKEAEFTATKKELEDFKAQAKADADALAKAKLDLAAKDALIEKAKAAGGVAPIVTGAEPTVTATGKEKPKGKDGKELSGIALAAAAFVARQPEIAEWENHISGRRS